jgi:hypothetical protein
MTQTYTIEVTRQPVDTDDTTCHGVIVPQLTGRLFQIAPGAAIRLTLPDSAPVDTKSMDVQGFSLSVEALEEEDVQGHVWWIFALGGGVAAGLGWSMAETLQQEFGTTAPKNPKSNDNP